MSRMHVEVMIFAGGSVDGYVMCSVQPEPNSERDALGTSYPDVWICDVSRND
jgi:hypothetical protein